MIGQSFLNDFDLQRTAVMPENQHKCVSQIPSATSRYALAPLVMSCCCLFCTNVSLCKPAGTRNCAEIGPASLQLSKVLWICSHHTCTRPQACRSTAHLSAQIRKVTDRCGSAVLQLHGHVASCRSFNVQFNADALCINLHGTAP